MESICTVCYRPTRGVFWLSGSKIEYKTFQSQLLRLYPNGEVLAIVLHSVVNLWGYSLYSNGRLIRSAAGDSNNGLIINTGSPLPEEERILNDCPIDKIDEDGFGEDLVFDVTTRFFGKRIDEFDEINLEMTAYSRKNSGFKAIINKMLGRP
ncbi:hypothetical protein [Geobacter sp.]|uniref:DUF6928 family protein n=1 Tax=Geobacter sp. TaxID=46610 RepID=UPI0027B9CC78|nr:hypothetical protein [Geobacter sp.]